MTSGNILWPRMIAKSLANALYFIRHIPSLADTFLVLCCLLFAAQLATAGSSGNGSNRGGTDHYYCTSNEGSTWYVSAEFDFSWPPGTVRVQDSVIGNEFKEALAAKYGYQGPVVCFGTKTTAQTQAQLQNGISGARSSGRTVVETGWIWSGAKVAGGGASGATATAQPTPAVGSSHNSSANSESGSAPGGSVSGGSVPANSAGQAQNLPAVGTTLAVRILDAVDSSKDPAGKQYRGTVTTAVDAGNGVTIPRGSMAMVTLMKDQGGWSAHLQSVTVNGQVVTVASGPASVTGSTQSSVASAASTVTSALGSFGRFGHKPPKPSGVEAITSGDRVVLPPGTQVQFVLSWASVPSGGGVPSAMGIHPGGSGVGVQPAGTSNSSLSGGGQAVSGGALSAKIGETLLGPSKQAAMFVVSPDGGHYAVPAMHGSSEVIVIDGVDGPEFDHAAHMWGGEAIDFVFSSDGRHSAYVAQSGDDLVEVRDGKTAFTIASIKPGTNLASSSPVPKIDQRHIHNPGHQVGGGGHQCLMSPSGAHVAVVAHAGNPSESGGFYMFLDGVKSPEYNFIDVGQVAFVAEKLVYIAQTNDHKWHLVVNNEPGPAYGGLKNLQVNDDSSHYAFIGSTGGLGWGVGVDGVLGAPRGIIDNMFIASNGRVAYTTVARMNGATATQTGSSGLYIDDHELGPVQQPFAVVDSSGRGSDAQPYVLFSPDGKRFAYTKRVPGGVAAVIDGKVGRAYDGIGVFQFSPDSKHYFYVGNRKSNFLVYDGQEMPGEDTVSDFVFSQTGDRFAYLAKSAQAGTRMIVDGKASPPFYGLIPNSMSFSEDGKHYAYAIHSNVSDSQFIRDGVATNVPSLVSFTTRTGPPHIDFPPLIFSGDGTRLVWGWPKADGVSKDVISIDGQEIMHGYSMYEFPEFSPDSRHFATMIRNANKYTVAVDGKIGPGYDDFLEVNRNVARFLDSHTFRFLGVKNGSVYRVTVSLGG